MRFTLATLGCKVNQCESAHLALRLEEMGHERAAAGSAADVHLVNTCAVTSRAAYQSRQMLRRGVRAGGVGIALGCYGQVEPEELINIPGVVAVVGTVEKLSLPGLLVSLVEKGGVFISGLEDAGTLPPLDIKRFPGRARGFLKVQDGCDSLCSYCIVPRARGGPRSLPIKDAKEGFRALIESGHREVVLTGIHLGFWGREMGQDVTALLKELLEAPGDFRIRLSSLEPTEVVEGLLRLMERDERICPHLHIPLQSGSEKVLKAMGRWYSPGFYRELVLSARKRIPHIGLGADVLAGFPGEGEKEFEETVKLIEDLPLSYLHVFPYSPRPGTRALAIEEKVSGKVAKKRAAILRNLGDKKKEAFAASRKGERVRVLVERRTKEGLMRGFAANYLPVLLEGNAMPGSFVEAEVKAARGGEALARAVD